MLKLQEAYGSVGAIIVKSPSIAYPSIQADTTGCQRAECAVTQRRDVHLSILVLMQSHWSLTSPLASSLTVLHKWRHWLLFYEQAIQKWQEDFCILILLSRGANPPPLSYPRLKVFESLCDDGFVVLMGKRHFRLCDFHYQR